MKKVIAVGSTMPVTETDGVRTRVFTTEVLRDDPRTQSAVTKVCGYFLYEIDPPINK